MYVDGNRLASGKRKDHASVLQSGRFFGKSQVQVDGTISERARFVPTHTVYFSSECVKLNGQIDWFVKPLYGGI